MNRAPLLASGPRTKGVRLVISNQHLGLKQAIEAVMGSGAGVHSMGNVLARVKRDNAHMVRRHPDDLRPTRRRLGPGAVRPDRGHAGGPVPRRRHHAHRRQEGPVGLRGPSPEAHGGRCGHPTRWNVSTGRSSGAPTWSGCSPTTEQWNAWSPRWWSRPTTSGGWPIAAICRRPQWPSSAGTGRPSLK